MCEGKDWGRVTCVSENDEFACVVERRRVREFGKDVAETVDWAVEDFERRNLFVLGMRTHLCVQYLPHRRVYLTLQGNLPRDPYRGHTVYPDLVFRQCEVRRGCRL